MIIKNERQYRITRAQAEKFTQALHRATEGRTAESGVHPLLRKAQEDAIRSQLDNLRAELAEYNSGADQGAGEIFQRPDPLNCGFARYQLFPTDSVRRNSRNDWE